MSDNNEISLIPDEFVARKIYFIRGKKVMLDRDLAELYEVETKVLKQQVRRNMDRFPDDFMFELTKEEFGNWRSQFVTSNSDKMGLRYPPFAFTEQGVAMLSSILKSKRAIQVNIQIIRIFVHLREMLQTHQEVLLKLDEFEKKLTEHDDKFLLIFEYLKQFEQAKREELEYQERKRIGFIQNKDEDEE